MLLAPVRPHAGWRLNAPGATPPPSRPRPRLGCRLAGPRTRRRASGVRVRVREHIGGATVCGAACLTPAAHSAGPQRRGRRKRVARYAAAAQERPGGEGGSAQLLMCGYTRRWRGGSAGAASGEGAGGERGAGSGLARILTVGGAARGAGVLAGRGAGYGRRRAIQSLGAVSRSRLPDPRMRANGAGA